MAKTVINVGTSANDGTGDPLRTAMQSTNSNFNEVYTLFGNGSTLAVSGDVSVSGGTATIGSGAVMSAGFLIFASGKHGQRYIGKNTGIMNHQHSDAMESKMHDMRSAMKENVNCEQRSMQILRDATGFPLAEVRKKFNNPSDQYFTAKQLVDLKVADHIL